MTIREVLFHSSDVVSHEPSSNFNLLALWPLLSWKNILMVNQEFIISC